MIKTVITCPLGSECEKVVDGELHRCAWYVSLEGQHPQDGTRISESKCAMAWQPLLMVESTRESSRIGASVQSLRNETLRQQKDAIEVIKNVQIPSNT